MTESEIENGVRVSITQEEDLSNDERRRAWMTVYGAVHWGAENARPIEIDQRYLIMVVAALLKERDELRGRLGL